MSSYELEKKAFILGLKIEFLQNMRSHVSELKRKIDIRSWTKDEKNEANRRISTINSTVFLEKEVSSSTSCPSADRRTNCIAYRDCKILWIGRSENAARTRDSVRVYVSKARGFSNANILARVTSSPFIFLLENLLRSNLFRFEPTYD